MQTEQVIAILDSVAAGVDPVTGQRIPSEVFHSADVIRAFYNAANLLRNLGAGSTHASSAGVRTGGSKTLASAGTRWTSAEDAMLRSEYDGGMPIGDIATQHGRTRSAITMRLAKLGKITIEQNAVARVEVRASQS